MRTVEDDEGQRYLLVKRSTESSLVRDPATGEERHLANDSLELVEDAGPLETAANGVAAPLRRVLTASHDERALGLLLELDEHGPTAVRVLLDRYDLCESDLHGIIGEFRAAGLVAEAEVPGGRGYETTADASDALATLRQN
jgi:hypothetical protein